MKILFVSTAPLEYSASANMRNIALLEGFIENGHIVSICTPEVQIDSSLYDPSQCNLKFKDEFRISVGTMRASLSVNNSKSKTFKVKIKQIIYNFFKKIKMYDFRTDIANKKVIINDKFDVMISSSDPKSSHLLAENILKNNPKICKKWIQYWGDPFAGDVNDKRKFIKYFIKREEARLISLCDSVFYVSPFTLKAQIKMYPKYQYKMHFLPIPYKEAVIYDNVNNNKNKYLTIGYFGDYYSRNRNIVPLYNTVKKNHKYDLKVCGNTDLKLNDTVNINIRGRVSASTIKELESKCDILCCICNKSGTQIPGKVYHYAATNKPILILLDGEYKKELKEYFDSFNRFLTCNNDSAEISKCIDNIFMNNISYSPCEKLNCKNISNEFIKGSEYYEKENK